MTIERQLSYRGENTELGSQGKDGGYTAHLGCMLWANNFAGPCVLVYKDSFVWQKGALQRTQTGKQ